MTPKQLERLIDRLNNIVITIGEREEEEKEEPEENCVSAAVFDCMNVLSGISLEWSKRRREEQQGFDEGAHGPALVEGSAAIN